MMSLNKRGQNTKSYFASHTSIATDFMVLAPITATPAHKRQSVEHQKEYVL